MINLLNATFLKIFLFVSGIFGLDLLDLLEIEDELNKSYRQPFATEYD